MLQRATTTPSSSTGKPTEKQRAENQKSVKFKILRS